MELRIKRLTETAILPVKAHPTDSGFDIFADEDVIIEPGETAVIKTGIAIALPPNHEAQIRPKSGVTSKTKLRVQLGTVDEPYRGEIGVIVDNVSIDWVRDDFWTKFIRLLKGKEAAPNDLIMNGSFKVSKGDKIAQMVIAPVAHPEVVEVDELNETDRGENGFGSTGVTAP